MNGSNQVFIKVEGMLTFCLKKKTKTLNFSEKGKGKDVEWRNVMKAEVQGRKEEADIFRMGQPLENETNDLQEKSEKKRGRLPPPPPPPPPPHPLICISNLNVILMSVLFV